MSLDNQTNDSTSNRYSGTDLLGGGIAISIVTGLAYLSVYGYDIGYCGFFAIPRSFISISVPDLVATAIGFLIVAVYSSYAIGLFPESAVADMDARDGVYAVLGGFGIVLALNTLVSPSGPRTRFLAIALGMLCLLAAATMFLWRTRHRQWLSKSGKTHTPEMMPLGALMVFMPRKLAMFVLFAPLVSFLIMEASITFGSFRASQSYVFSSN